MGNTIKNSTINQNGNVITQVNDELWINGEKIDVPKSLFFKNCFVQCNGKNYINGKEWIASKQKWCYTLKSLWNSLF